MCGVFISLEKQNLTWIDLQSSFIREPKINKKKNKIPTTLRNRMLFSVFIFIFLHFYENDFFFLGQTEYNNNNDCIPKTIMNWNNGRLLIYLPVKHTTTDLFLRTSVYNHNKLNIRISRTPGSCIKIKQCIVKFISRHLCSVIVCNFSLCINF